MFSIHWRMNTLPLILVVEDNYEDTILIRRAFRTAGVANPCHFLPDGEKLLAYLKGEGTFVPRQKFPLPGLILLDLKLPGKDGFELLHWIRTHQEFAAIRVVVLTASTELRDVNRAYQLGANSFLTKPLEFENLGALLTTLEAQHIFPSNLPAPA